MLFHSERRFRLWDYNVSHDQVLLRSPGSAETGRNIDVIFLGVKYLSIPSMFTGLTLDQASLKDSALVLEWLKTASETCYVYALTTGGQRSYIAAVGFKVLENDLDLFDSSLENFADAAPDRNLGEVLVHS